MKMSAERIIEVGYKRDPKNIFDEVEQVTAQMIREGWSLSDSCMEDGLGFIHLFFEKEAAVD
jgi:hypothetical protein